MTLRWLLGGTAVLRSDMIHASHEAAACTRLLFCQIGRGKDWSAWREEEGVLSRELQPSDNPPPPSAFFTEARGPARRCYTGDTSSSHQDARE